MEKGVTETGNITHLQRLTENQGTPITEDIQKVVEGWEGKTKGLLQITWEHGFIDMTNLQQYTIDGKKDAFGVLQPETNLKQLLANCTDFEQEELLLQSMGCLMGVEVD